jgi:branched-chain amino acid transport system substrate-binding protein
MRKRMVKEKRLGMTLLAMALAILLVLTACAPRPIAEEKTAQFGWILPITGGASAAIAPVVAGGQDYVRYFNEQEAIPGVDIELLWRDTAFQFALGLSHYERFVEAGIPLIGAVDSALVLGLKGRFERDEVVAFIPGATYQEELYPEPGWLYAVTPLISEQATVLFQYFMENWKEERPPRLALVGISESQFGWEPRYAIGYARSLGFEVLPWEAVPIVVLDATVQLLRLAEAEADLVHLQTMPEGAGPILRDAERLGLLDKFQFAGHSSTMGDRTIKVAGAATEGYLASMTYPWFDETEVPGIELIIDNMMKYHGEVKRDGEYYFGWVSAAVISEAIKRAIENVGYENLDGPAIKEALDGMQDFDVYGLASITYKPGDHRGTTRMAVYEARGGKIVRLSDWQEAPLGRDWEYE